MNILLVLEFYYPHIGGVEVVFKQLAEGLAAKGHTVTVLTQRLPGTKKNEISKGVKIIRVNTVNRYLFTLLAIPKAVQLAKKADIIHTTTYNGAFPAKVASLIAKKPSLITVHEVLGKLWGKMEMSKRSALIHRTLEKFVIGLKFDKYIAVSDSTRRQTIAAGVPKKKIQRVYNGVAYDFWKKDNFKNIRSKIEKKEKEFLILFFGRPGITKGLTYLIEAMPNVKKEIPNIRLLAIVSKANAYKKQYQELTNRIEKLNLEDSVTVISPQKRESLGAYIRSVDCVVVPSLSEGFGFSAAETCALGTPIVASNTTSLPEVVSGKYVLVKPKNPEAIAQGIIMVKNKKYATSSLKKFEISENIRAYEEIYRKMTINK